MTTVVQHATKTKRELLHESALFALNLADKRRWSEEDVVRSIANGVLELLEENARLRTLLHSGWPGVGFDANS